ncbi:MAG: DMT family transporter [Pikeienuella sp.]
MSPAGPGGRAWALLILLGPILGSSFMLTNIVMRAGEIGPLTVASMRLSFAAILLVAAARLAGARMPGLNAGGGRIWAIAAISAALGNILPFVLISWSQRHIPSALGGVLMAPMPLASLVLSHFLVRGERMNAARVIGFLVGLAGIALLIGPETLSLLAEGGDGRSLLGRLAGLAAMLCYVLNGIALKRAGPVDALGMSAAVIALAALVALPLALWLERPDPSAIPLRSWVATAALGLGATAAAQIIMMRVLALAGPPFLASVHYQVPLWATFLGVVFLDEALAPFFWAALALILAGLALAQFAARPARIRGESGFRPD